MIKLARLPERVPVKLTICLPPELNQRLAAYAELYRETYGSAEPVTELIPAILQGFLDADRSFAKTRRTSVEP